MFFFYLLLLLLHFFFFLVFLTPLTLKNSKNNYRGCVLRLAEENVEGMPGEEDQVTLNMG